MRQAIYVSENSVSQIQHETVRKVWIGKFGKIQALKSLYFLQLA
jgi:hypothetical protein